MWRNNWALVESGALDNPSYGTSEALAASASRRASRRNECISFPSSDSRLTHAFAVSAPIAPKDRFLKTEYQTVRRLPSTGAVLFTIRTFVEPVEARDGDACFPSSCFPVVAYYERSLVVFVSSDWNR